MLNAPVPHLLCRALSCLSVAVAATAFGYDPIPLEGFADGIRHWRNGNDRREYPCYRPDQIVEIADNILRYQRVNGGWPANEDPTRILDATEQEKLEEHKAALDTTFDNRSTYTHVDYLAAAYSQTGDWKYRDAALRGLLFILAAQTPTGGWPHSYPSTEQDYHPRITIADEVMPGVLAMLRRVVAERQYEFLPRKVRLAAHQALERGNRCLLALQVRDEQGRLTAWAGQYDPVTLQPARGRSFELPGVVAQESVPVVRYLMSIESPPDEVVAAIEGAMDWFKRGKIQGLRYETVPAEPVRYRYHTSTFDRRTVEDPAAPALWARFYEMARPEPFLANRDGRKVYTLAEVDRERRTGYSWYGEWPAELLEKDYPAWKQRVGR
jgi:PelA/Pel-15E family pectate lyase